jgi:hypothetical protein
MPARSSAPPFLLASAALLLGGCAASNNYPSLAPRPIEDISLAEPAPQPGPPSLAPDQAAARYAPLLDAVRKADAAFTRALETERPSLARSRSAAVGSDEWAAAQQAFSRLATKRGDVVQSVSALQAATETPDAQNDPALAAAAAQALGQAKAIDEREAAALDALEPRPA